jgi:Tol biopolymer transport system component
LALNPGTRLGPYEIAAPLGVGGMGEVYRARDTKLNRDVAIKVLLPAVANDPDRLARFRREAQVLASLNHPNIAHIHGLEDANDVRALVMELVEGPTLADRIAQGAIPLDETLPIARQIAEALEAAHEQGIIHRDLKPGNIALTKDGHVKILDFGLAKSIDPLPSAMDVTNSPTITWPAMLSGVGVILGTAAYMSPEQAKGRAADRRSDVWAFGCVLYEMLTGRRAFVGDDVGDTLAHVLRGDPDWNVWPTDVPRTVRSLVRQCLCKDARQRPGSLSAARFALSPDSLASDAAAPETVSQPSRALLPWSLAVLFAGAAAAASVVVVRHVREVPAAPDPIEFRVPQPDGGSFPGIVPELALSPDGRQLVFVAVAQGKQQLWIRSMSGGAARPLAGTESAETPFWSADSRFVAFFASRKLKKVAAAGGPSVAVCDAVSSNGGTWNRENVIVFGAGGAGLFYVSAGGGEPRSATTVDRNHGEISQRWPAFLPDGRHFLFYSSGPREIRMGSLDSSAVRTIVSDASLGMYSAGHVLFSRGGTLMALPFDARTLQTTGDTFPVAENVAESSRNGYAPFSASPGGVLSFASLTSQTVRLSWFDRTGSRLGDVGAAGDLRDMALSVDGRRIALSLVSPNSPVRDVWTLNEHGTTSRITFDPAVHAGPAWSPDGARIAYASTPKGGLRAIASNGSGGEEELFPIEGPGRATDWSRDGKFIAYRNNDLKTAADLWIVPTARGEKPIPFLHTAYDEDNGKFSADVKWIAYDSDENGDRQVFVQPFPPTGAKYQVSSSGGRQPYWRGDGGELYFLASDSSLTAVDVKTSDSFHAGLPHALFTTGSSGRARSGGGAYAATDDGKRFLVLVPEQRSNPTPLTVVVNWLEQVKARVPMR